MAQRKRLSPNQKAELKADLAGLKTIISYNPAKNELKTSEIEAIDTQLDSIDEQIVQTEAHLADLRNQSADIGSLYTKKIKGVHQQIIAQFGDDSPEYEAVGGKRTSNRAAPRRRSRNRGSISPS